MVVSGNGMCIAPFKFYFLLWLHGGILVLKSKKGWGAELDECLGCEKFLARFVVFFDKNSERKK